jgi:hypothetical protein
MSQKSKGKIPVAIMSNDEFDAPSAVDMASLSFGRSGDEAKAAFCHSEDVDQDGLADLVCHFDAERTGF